MDLARPASGAKTFGYLRAEILGALFNGLMLWALVIFVWFEAAQRLRDPPTVHSPTMMAVATFGIAVNSFSAWMTSGAGLATRARRYGGARGLRPRRFRSRWFRRCAARRRSDLFHRMARGRPDYHPSLSDA